MAFAVWRCAGYRDADCGRSGHECTALLMPQLGGRNRWVAHPQSPADARIGMVVRLAGTGKGSPKRRQYSLQRVWPNAGALIEIERRAVIPFLICPRHSSQAPLTRSSRKAAAGLFWGQRCWLAVGHRATSQKVRAPAGEDQQPQAVSLHLRRGGGMARRAALDLACSRRLGGPESGYSMRARAAGDEVQPGTGPGACALPGGLSLSVWDVALIRSPTAVSSHPQAVMKPGPLSDGRCNCID